MKLKHTQSKKANRGPNITAGYPYRLPIFQRRINNILAPDSREYSAKHPGLDDKVAGYKSRNQLVQRTTNK